MIDTENQIILNGRLGNHMAEQLEKNIPLSANFRYSVSFQVCGTANQGLMKMEYHSPDRVYGQLGIVRKGTDRMYSNFISDAAVEDMIRYLRDSATHQEWLEQIKQLSDKVDNFWD